MIDRFYMEDLFSTKKESRRLIVTGRLVDKRMKYCPKGRGAMESDDRYNVHSAQIFRCCIDDAFGTNGEHGVRFRETGTVGNMAYT